MFSYIQKEKKILFCFIIKQKKEIEFIYTQTILSL